jgi:Family of unknown function (DUF6334)
VHGRRYESGYQELVFVFEHGTLRIACDADSDEVVVTADGPGNELPEVAEQPLIASVGKVIEQAWAMKNDRGFDDGFQLRCIDLDTRAEVSVQVEAAAGTLMLAEVRPLRRHS